VEKVLRPVTWAIVIVLVLAFVIVVRRRWTSVRAEYAALDAARAEDAGPGPS
jgi:hypothetical protein